MCIFSTIFISPSPIVKEGKVIEVVEGADPPQLTNKVKFHAESKLQPAPRPAAPVPVKTTPAPPPATPAPSGTNLNERLATLVNQAPVMVPTLDSWYLFFVINLLHSSS